MDNRAGSARDAQGEVMKTIYKYQLFAGHDVMEMPKGAQVLTVQAQNDKPHIWALVDPYESSVEARRFGVYGTGHDMPDDLGPYIGTFQLEGGSLVFHVFDQSTTTVGRG